MQVSLPTRSPELMEASGAGSHLGEELGIRTPGQTQQSLRAQRHLGRPRARVEGDSASSWVPGGDEGSVLGNRPPHPYLVQHKGCGDTGGSDHHRVLGEEHASGCHLRDRAPFLLKNNY